MVKKGKQKAFAEKLQMFFLKKNVKSLFLQTSGSPDYKSGFVSVNVDFLNNVDPMFAIYG